MLTVREEVLTHPCPSQLILLSQEGCITLVSLSKLLQSEALVCLLNVSVSHQMLLLNSDSVTTKPVVGSAPVLSRLENQSRTAALLG